MAIVQKGQALLVGWNSYTKSGYVTDDVKISKGAEVETIRGGDNETLTKLISDPHTALDLTLIIHSGGTVVPPAVGDTFTINTVNYFVEAEPQCQLSRTIAKLTLKLKKEDSMTYT